MQAKVVGKAGYHGTFSGYVEYVPMVDKAVDSTWKEEAPIQNLSVSKGQYIVTLTVWHTFLIVKPLVYLFLSELMK